MNKPLSIIIDDTKKDIVRVCNESMLSPVVLDLILQGLYDEIHTLATKQIADEREKYTESAQKEDNKKASV